MVAPTCESCFHGHVGVQDVVGCVPLKANLVRCVCPEPLFGDGVTCTRSLGAVAQFMDNLESLLEWDPTFWASVQRVGSASSSLVVFVGEEESTELLLVSLLHSAPLNLPTLVLCLDPSLHSTLSLLDVPSVDVSKVLSAANIAEAVRASGDADPLTRRFFIEALLALLVKHSYTVVRLEPGTILAASPLSSLSPSQPHVEALLSLHLAHMVEEHGGGLHPTTIVMRGGEETAAFLEHALALVLDCSTCFSSEEALNYALVELGYRGRPSNDSSGTHLTFTSSLGHVIPAASLRVMTLSEEAFVMAEEGLRRYTSRDFPPPTLLSLSGLPSSFQGKGELLLRVMSLWVLRPDWKSLCLAGKSDDWIQCARAPIGPRLPPTSAFPLARIFPDAGYDTGAGGADVTESENDDQAQGHSKESHNQKAQVDDKHRDTTLHNSSRISTQEEKQRQEWESCLRAPIVLAYDHESSLAHGVVTGLEFASSLVFWGVDWRLSEQTKNALLFSSGEMSSLVDRVVHKMHTVDYDVTHADLTHERTLFKELATTFVATHLSEWARQARFCAWGFKNPLAVFLLPFLKDVFPSMTVVHVVRDPRSVALTTSIRPIDCALLGLSKRGGGGQGEESSCSSPALVAKSWALINSGVLAWASVNLPPSQYVQIAAEGLCTGSIETADRLSVAVSPRLPSFMRPMDSRAVAALMRSRLTHHSELGPDLTCEEGAALIKREELRVAFAAIEASVGSEALRVFGYQALNGTYK